MTVKPLSICLISQEFPPHTNWGGIAVYNGELAAAYTRKGHRVTVISRAHPGAPRRDSHSGVTILRVGRPIHRKRFTGRTIDRILHARAVWRAIRALDSRRPFDVFETTEAGLEGEQLVRQPHVRRRLVIQCNGSNAFGETAGGWLAPLHRADWMWSFRREQHVLRQVPAIIVTSDATRRVLTAQGISHDCMTLIPQGIDTDRFHPPGKRRTGPLHVGFVGRLEKRKGIDFIWRVIERLAPTRRFEFHLKGAIHPASREDMRRRLAEFGESVRHHPAGGHDTMPGFYQSIDVLLQPSRFENFGLAYAEAMACGVVVLAGHRGGGAELIEHGVTGFLVDPDGPIDPAIEVLRQAVDHPESFDDMRRAARAVIVEKYSLDQCADRKLLLYASLVASDPRMRAAH